MVAKSVDKQGIKKTAVTLVLLAIVAGAAIIGIRAVKDTGVSTAGIPAGTTEERENYLAGIGLQVDTRSTVAEVEVPQEFDERFQDYNVMQQAMGFDLEPLKGQRLTKCVYTVTNREDLGAMVSAVLLVKDGQLVGGHLLVDETGEILPLFEVQLPETQPEQDPGLETILPVEDPVEQTSGEGEAQQTGGDAAEQPSEETFAPEESDYPTD